MVIDSTDINRLNLAQQELHQMMESDVSLCTLRDIIVSCISIVQL
jgi:hypothetical protein